VISKRWNYIFEHSFTSEELQIKEIESENFQHLVRICEVFFPNGRLYIPTTTNYFQIVHDAIKEVQKWIFGQSLYDWPSQKMFL
jgi:hypothetical protein